MGVAGHLLVALVMAVGLVGVVVPVLPGLLLVAAAALGWAALDGGGTAQWATASVVVALCVAGAVAAWVLPARTLRDAGAPARTLVAGLLGAVVGFVAVPVVGLPLGALLAVWLAETVRLSDRRAGWRSTVATAKGFGLGVLLELAAGLLAVGVWAVAALTVA